MSLHEEKFKVGDLIKCDEEDVTLAIVLDSNCRMDGGRRYTCRVIQCGDKSRLPMFLHSDNYHMQAVDLPPGQERLVRLLFK